MQCAISFLFPISLQFGQQIEVNWVQSESADQQKVFDATQAHFEWTIDPFSVWGGVVSYVTSRQLINQAFKTTGLLSDALKFETQLTGTDRWPISIKLNLCNKKANSKHFFFWQFLASTSISTQYKKVTRRHTASLLLFGSKQFYSRQTAAQA